MLASPSIILGAIPGRRPNITAFAWPSYAWFANSANGHNNYWFRSFTTVMYDPEGWAATPPPERRDPIAYLRRFARIGHARGWDVIVSPDPSLMSVPGAACGATGSETEDAAYVRCNIAGRAARYADVVETQAQHLQASPDAYRAFVGRTADQARAANPHVLVISGLTTGRGYTPAQMYGAWASVRGVVDGYYLSISSKDRIPTALAFLRMLPFSSSSASVSS